MADEEVRTEVLMGFKLEDETEVVRVGVVVLP